MTVELPVCEEPLFPEPVRGLLRTLHGVGFFEDSVLVGSWVMPLYGRLIGIVYPLRTLDIDFAVQLASARCSGRTDLEAVLLALGYLPSTSQSGVQRFTREGFTVEFLAHRRGGRDRDAVFVRSWNITAQPLPFLNLLLDHAFWTDFRTHKVKAPLPEAFFVHKLITAQRRLEAGKSGKDLEQCAAIAPKLEQVRLRAVMKTLKLSPVLRKALRASAEAISFPPHELGIG